ncbi:MAG: hypothetical protein IKD76_01605 [Clostridia bacterium]|nr:hypothetical protein [Clostridia bacterium]
MKNISVDDAWKKILSLGRCVIEELIVQVGELSKFHPTSINSVRIATYNNNGNVDVLFSGIRMGRGNAVVDNAGNGGIFASIDVETGIVNSIGRTKNGKKFVKHPDSLINIIGFEIPEWASLCNTVKETANLLKEHQLIGWDFALSDKGWVMIEANAESEFGIRQICLGGFRKDAEKYIK